MSNILLELANISKYFGELPILSDVSFNVAEGEIVGLIGPNGAGKTSLFNPITGIYHPDEGAIRFHGKNLIGLKSHQICKRGRKKALFNQALKCLKIFKPEGAKDTISSHLTYPDCRLIETAAVLASRPTLAFLDEPFACFAKHYSSLILKAKAKKIDALILSGIPEDTITLTRQMKENDFSVPYFHA